MATPDNGDSLPNDRDSDLEQGTHVPPIPPPFKVKSFRSSTNEDGSHRHDWEQHANLDELLQQCNVDAGSSDRAQPKLPDFVFLRDDDYALAKLEGLSIPKVAIDLLERMMRSEEPGFEESHVRDIHLRCLKWYSINEEDITLSELRGFERPDCLPLVLRKLSDLNPRYFFAGPTFQSCKCAILQSIGVILSGQTVVFAFRSPHSATLIRPFFRERLSRNLQACDKLVGALERAWPSGRSSLCISVVLCEIHRLILKDEYAVFEALDFLLREIDLEMPYSGVVRTKIATWRFLLGLWRAHLHWRNGIVWYADSLSVLHGMTSKDDKNENKVDDFTQIRSNLPSKCAAVLTHCDSTFTSLMSTMSIIESEKAINQAEEVTKLTQLAFFFIPLTFVCGVFGMNVGEYSPDGPRLWTWAATSVAILVATYIILYRRKLWSFICTLPTLSEFCLVYCPLWLSAIGIASAKA